MIVSETHRLAFFHIHKTGGTTVSKALAQRLGARTNSYQGAVLHNHTHASELLARFPELRAFFKCTVVRNPWDRLVSTYHWVRYDYSANTDARRRARGFLNDLGTFRDFARALHDSYLDHPDQPPGRTIYGDNGLVTMAAQWPYVCRADTTSLMDYVGRFEALRESIDHITSAVGGTHEAGALGHHNRSVRGPYREFYDEESSRWIGEIYARDCELFGYSFEETRRTLATRAGG